MSEEQAKRLGLCLQMTSQNVLELKTVDKVSRHYILLKRFIKMILQLILCREYLVTFTNQLHQTSETVETFGVEGTLRSQVRKNTIDFLSGYLVSYIHQSKFELNLKKSVRLTIIFK